MWCDDTNQISLFRTNTNDASEAVLSIAKKSSSTYYYYYY